MALLFVLSFSGAEGWRNAFAAAMPGLDVRMWPNLGDTRDIDGTDGLLRDPDLPEVPTVRAGNSQGDAMMNEAALLHVLRHHRRRPSMSIRSRPCRATARSGATLRSPLCRTSRAD